MAGLMFAADDLLDELLTLKSLAGPFKAHGSTYDLSELEGQIKGLVAAGAGASRQLEIPKDRPWKTRLSEGEFESPGKNCNTSVYAEVTGKWAATIVVDNPGKKPSQQKRRVAFGGVASTVIRVIDSASETPISVWKMELGDANSPGCYFHTHAGSAPGFPIPRHPSLFATPMAAMGFALGELFQAAWAEAVQSTAGPGNRWRSIQKRRVTAILKWALSEVECATSSPWMALKAAKPKDDMFLP